MTKQKWKSGIKAAKTLQNEITDHNSVAQFSLTAQRVQPLRNNELLVLHENSMQSFQGEFYTHNILKRNTQLWKRRNQVLGFFMPIRKRTGIKGNVVGHLDMLRQEEWSHHTLGTSRHM